MLDIAAAGVERVDLRLIDVETDHVRARAGELEGQRQADVALADNGDLGDQRWLGIAVHIG